MADSSHVDSNVITNATDSSGSTVIAVVQSNVTESSRVDSVITTGGKGEKGDTGSQGPQGDTGPQGEQGVQGEKGDKGDAGDQGPQGEVGPQGDTGATGATGPQGETGATGATGATGPKGDKGDQGDPGADGIMASIVAGTNITVDDTDPANPIVSATGGTGDVVGPSSSTDNALAMFDSTTGKLLKDDSGITHVTVGASQYLQGALGFKSPGGGINLYLGGSVISNNYLTIYGGSGSDSPTIGVSPLSTGTNVGIELDTKGSGRVTSNAINIPTISSTDTLTNKRISLRTGTTTSSATPTINTDDIDFYSLTAQTAAITSFTTNLSGTPTEGQKLWVAITGTASRAITWGSSFEAGTVALPTTTSGTSRLDIGFIWNTVTSKWRCVAVA